MSDQGTSALESFSRPPCLIRSTRAHPRRDCLPGWSRRARRSRQRRHRDPAAHGTLLAAHALVASFLGATTVKAKGLHAFSWAALVALVLGLVIGRAAVDWKLRFAVDAPDFYAELYDQAAALMVLQTIFWLVALR
jgi:hypothetical protein